MKRLAAAALNWAAVAMEFGDISMARAKVAEARAIRTGEIHLDLPWPDWAADCPRGVHLAYRVFPRGNAARRLAARLGLGPDDIPVVRFCPLCGWQKLEAMARVCVPR